MKLLFPAYLLLTVLASAAWTPPEKPNPSTILHEAQYQDIDAKRYEDALAKFEWYHKNALSINPAQYGVRLSFALASWADLAAVYPPALESLKKTRDEAVATVKDNPSRGAFREAMSIDQYLKDDAATADLFVWLVENHPESAKKVYPEAEEALIRAKSYKTCGPYLDPERSYRSAVAGLHRSYPGDHSEWQQKHFSQEAASLVALLVINGRQADADAYAGKAAAEWPDADFAKKLESAKQGVMP